MAVKYGGKFIDAFLKGRYLKLLIVVLSDSPFHTAEFYHPRSF